MPQSTGEPELEPLSADDARSVVIQTYELPVELPWGISLDLSRCRLYVLWSFSDAVVRLPGLHMGHGLSAWSAILHLSAGEQYAPGVNISEASLTDDHLSVVER
eukprot:1140272-Amphidinium_carterae.1